MSFRVLLIRVVLRTTDLVSIKAQSSFRCQSRRGRARTSARGGGNTIAGSFSPSSSIPLDSIRRYSAGLRASPAFGRSIAGTRQSLAVKNVRRIDRRRFFRDSRDRARKSAALKCVVASIAALPLSRGGRVDRASARLRDVTTCYIRIRGPLFSSRVFFLLPPAVYRSGIRVWSPGIRVRLIDTSRTRER